MSLDELRDDLKRNLAEARRITNVQEMRDHLVNTLWPTLEAMTEVMDEHDDSIAELVDHEEDYLQPETAGLFAAVIGTGMNLAAELKKRLTAADTELQKQVGDYEQLCEQAVLVLNEITMVPADGEPDDNEEDDDAEATEDDDE